MNIDKQDTDQKSMFILKACNEGVIMLTTDSTIKMTAEICSTHSCNPKISRIIVFHQLIFYYISAIPPYTWTCLAPAEFSDCCRKWNGSSCN